MARWSESRGYTLILTHPRGPDRYARLALVSKRTLFGQAYNVREARAEDASRSGREPEALGLGRMLSWRWLGEGEARELLSARMRTLETLGYAILGGAEDAQVRRGPWDWLRELVDRQLAQPATASASGEGADVSETEDDAAIRLRDSLARLGLEPTAVVEGIATILELDEDRVREPSPETLRALAPELLTMILPVWIEHESEELQTIGARWLALPATPYELDASVLERWVAKPGALARALAPRLEDEGLALLGPEGLGRLAKTAADPAVRGCAERWRVRLQPHVRAPG